MLVGGIPTIETAERLVRENVADYISLVQAPYPRAGVGQPLEIG